MTEYRKDKLKQEANVSIRMMLWCLAHWTWTGIIVSILINLLMIGIFYIYSSMLSVAWWIAGISSLVGIAVIAGIIVKGLEGIYLTYMFCGKDIDKFKYHMTRIPLVMILRIRKKCAAELDKNITMCYQMSSIEGRRENRNQENYTINETLEIIRIAAAITDASTYVHIWNDSQYRVEDYYKREYVKKYLESMKEIYDGNEWLRVLIISKERIEELAMHKAPIWEEYLDYHKENDVNRLFIYSPEDWNNMNKYSKIVDAAVGICDTNGKEKIKNVYACYSEISKSGEGDKEEIYKEHHFSYNDDKNYVITRCRELVDEYDQHKKMEELKTTTKLYRV